MCRKLCVRNGSPFANGCGGHGPGGRGSEGGRRRRRDDAFSVPAEKGGVRGVCPCPLEGVENFIAAVPSEATTYTGVGTLTRPVCSTIDSFAIDVRVSYFIKTFSVSLCNFF